MRNKYGIGFFIVTITAMLLLVFAYQLSFQKAKERAEAELFVENTLQADTGEDEPAVSADGDALKEDCYYLMEVNGYIVVYLSDKSTPYEYTSIRFDELPEGLQKEIRNGKYVESAEALYGFLENYSS